MMMALESPMKITHQRDGGRLVVRIRGDIDSSQCDCLTHFWDRHVDAGVMELAADLCELDSIDGLGIAALSGLLRRTVSGGADVTVRGAPQTLAHTLYKIGLLRPPRGVRLIDPRDEEPTSS